MLLLQCATSLLSPEPYLAISPFIPLTRGCSHPSPSPHAHPCLSSTLGPFLPLAPTLAPPLTLAPDPNPCPNPSPNPPQVPLVLLGGGAGWGVKWWYDRRSRQRMRTILQALTRWP